MKKTIIHVDRLVMLFAPDSLLSGAVAQDIGGTKHAGTVSGIINGMGSIGAAVQGVVVAYIATVGWHYVFYMLISCSVLGFVVLLPPFLRAWHESPRVVARSI